MKMDEADVERLLESPLDFECRLDRRSGDVIFGATRHARRNAQAALRRLPDRDFDSRCVLSFLAANTDGAGLVEASDDEIGFALGLARLMVAEGFVRGGLAYVEQ